MPRTRIKSITRSRARNLRKNATPAERRLWQALRQLNEQGLRFRRQAPIGPYIADFADHSAKLVVEVDGATHASDAAIAHDRMRTAFLHKQGFSVLRVTNLEVRDNLDGLVATILMKLGKL